MKTEYEYIEFVKKDFTGRKTGTWEVQNKKSHYYLGVIKWNAPWRQYCFFPGNWCVFSAGCMKDIIEFIESAMKERKCNGN